MDVRRAFDILPYQLEKFPQADCLAAKINGNWEKISTQQLKDQAELVSLGLRKLGIGKDDKVAIISMNRPEWMMADFGISQLGAVSVPMYPSITVEDYRYIFADAGVKAVFISNQDLYDKVKAATAGQSIPADNIFSFDKLPGARHFSELLEMGKGGDKAELERMKAAVQPDDRSPSFTPRAPPATPKA